MVNFQALPLEILYEALSVLGVISLKLVCSYSFCRYSCWEVGLKMSSMLICSFEGTQVWRSSSAAEHTVWGMPSVVLVRQTRR